MFLREELDLPKFRNDVPVCGGRPSLLLHRLLDQSTDKFNEFLKRATRFSMLVGTSGAGKTRTLYAYLSHEFGLYFVANNMGNGGSADFLSLVNDVAKPFTRPGEHDRNALVVTFATRLLLLTRLEIFLYCLKRGVTPHRWLLIQACCEHMLFPSGERPANTDVFEIHWKENLEANLSVFSLPQLEGEIARVNIMMRDMLALEQREIPPIFLDEAQTITVVRPSQGDYRSSVAAEDGKFEARPLTKPVFLGFFHAGFKHRVVFCGTGFILHFRSQEFASSANKRVVDDDMFSDFGSWSDATQMVEYARGIVEVNERVESIISGEIYQWFYGRFRPFAVLLEEVLLSGQDIGQFWRGLVDLFTNPREVIQVVARTYYEMVERLCTSDSQHRNRLRDDLLEATIQYFYYGRSYTLEFGRGRKQAEILERALGRVRGSEKIVIDEPLLLLAMHNYFVQAGYLKFPLDQKLHTLNHPSSEGLYWQRLVPLEIQNWWRAENGVMARMALFEGLKLTETLEKLKDEASEIVGGYAWENKPPFVVYIADDQYTSINYVHNSRPRCTFLVAENKAGTDIMWRVRFASGAILLVTAQLKLPKSIGTSNVDALRKAAPDQMLTREWDGSILCFLIVYPASRGKLPLVERRKLGRGRSKCTVVVDRSNASKMISEDHLKNLDQLKGDNFLPLDQCGQCGQMDDDGTAGDATQWIACDYCSNWYHIGCVGIHHDAFRCSSC